MQVDTSNNSTWPLLGAAGTASGTTGTAGGTGGTASLFGPAAILALGQGGAAATGYSNLVAPLPTLPNNLPIIWQFDLASVLNPAAATPPATLRSQEQQEAEDAAVKQAFELINAGETDQARELMSNLLDQNKTNAAAVQALGQAELADAIRTFAME